MSYTDYANAICHKTQKAAQAMLQAQVASGGLDVVESSQILAGIEPDDVPATRVVCVCKQATAEDGGDDGNWDAVLVLSISAPAADYPDEDDFHELCGAVYAHFQQGKYDTAANITSAAASIIYTAQCVRAVSQSWDRDGDTWRSEMVLSVKCCGSVIA